ncbi:MAG TPA: 3-dehydroquinate synthase, partial [Salinimicrobium sp.]|nr:3-dehydroquinate synthase [Salinimicrobium sp.]
MEKTSPEGSQNNVQFGLQAYEDLNTLIGQDQFSKIFILVDSNTHESCLPGFLPRLETSLEIEIVEMEQGEEMKNLDTCNSIWKVLSELEADRKSL